MKFEQSFAQRSDKRHNFAFCEIARISSKKAAQTSASFVVHHEIRGIMRFKISIHPNDVRMIELGKLARLIEKIHSSNSKRFPPAPLLRCEIATYSTFDQHVRCKLFDDTSLL